MARKDIQGALLCIVSVFIIQFLCYPSCSSASEIGGCDSRGILRVDGDRCVCKVNVQGSRCDQCKKMYFYLNENNAEGCIKCHCAFPYHTYKCMTVKREYSSISLMENGGQITDINEVPLGISITKNNDSSIQFSNGGYTQLFWRPNNISGDYISSYGGNIGLEGGFNILPYWMGRFKRGPKVVLVSSNGTRIANSYETPFHPITRHRWWFPLVESAWHWVPSNIENMNEDYNNSITVSRFDMLRFLSNIRSIMFRIPNRDLDSYDIKVKSASWPTSSESDEGVESRLEKCLCNSGYSGTSCEYCHPSRPIHTVINGIPQCISQQLYECLSSKPLHEC